MLGWLVSPLDTTRGQINSPAAMHAWAMALPPQQQQVTLVGMYALALCCAGRAHGPGSWLGVKGLRAEARREHAVGWVVGWGDAGGHELHSYNCLLYGFIGNCNGCITGYGLEGVLRVCAVYSLASAVTAASLPQLQHKHVTGIVMVARTEKQAKLAALKPFKGATTANTTTATCVQSAAIANHTAKSVHQWSEWCHYPPLAAAKCRYALQQRYRLAPIKGSGR